MIAITKELSRTAAWVFEEELFAIEDLHIFLNWILSELRITGITSWWVCEENISLHFEILMPSSISLGRYNLKTESLGYIWIGRDTFMVKKRINNFYGE